MKRLTAALFCFLAAAASASAREPDWSEGVRVPETGRANIYDLKQSRLKQAITAGRLHSLHYPVEVTGLLIPLNPVKDLLDGPHENPFRALLQKSIAKIAKLRSFDDIFRRLGAHEFPAESGAGAYYVPFPGGKRPDYRMGFTPVEHGGALGFTLGCATCHTASLFGRAVVGLTNRFPRPYDLFVNGIRGLTIASGDFFQATLGATDAETEMYDASRASARFIEVKAPQTVGLDTSLAQVALSPSKRAEDADATLDPWNAAFPRREKLRTFAADSKPAVWWNVKYKNRWLLDGSVVSGNPIATNLLWNEIGRGTDLQKLDSWLDGNRAVIQELTAAVFAAEAPRFTDFFPAEGFDLPSGRRGEKIFLNRCARCHGVYEKAWNRPDARNLSDAMRLETTRVRYHDRTPVIDVGTDPNRYQGMETLSVALNRLALSKKLGVQVTPQKGYVPPPLVGIWARWPYFHNNSAPSLCAVLTAGPLRTKSYYAGEAIDRARDFDRECNGYPEGAAVPAEWKTNPAAFFDSKKPGLGPLGHDEEIFLDHNGREILSLPDKRDLIHFLQTL